MDLISIILPVYNVEKYLTQCLDSLVSQKYTNIEIIAIDDGSTDHSGEICDRYAAKDSRIRVIHKENGGLANVCNVGLKNVSPEAKYIGFVDSDDYVSENLYSNLMDALTANRADIAVTGFVCVNDDEEILDKSSEGVIGNAVYTREELIDHSVNKGGWCYRVRWNKLYRKELFKGLSYPEHKAHEDEALVFYLFMRCRKIVCIDSFDYYYRVSNSGSIMSNRIKKRNTDLMDVFVHNARLLAHHKYNYAAGKMMLRVALEYGSLCADRYEHREACRLVYRKVLNQLKSQKILSYKVSAVCYLIYISPTLGYRLIILARRILNNGR